MSTPNKGIVFAKIVWKSRKTNGWLQPSAINSSKPRGRGESDFQLPHYNVQMSNFQTYTETGMYGPFIWEKNKSTNCPKGAQTLDLLDIDFKSAVLNMLTELKGTRKNDV